MGTHGKKIHRSRTLHEGSNERRISGWMNDCSHGSKANVPKRARLAEPRTLSTFVLQSPASQTNKDTAGRRECATDSLPAIESVLLFAVVEEWILGLEKARWLAPSQLPSKSSCSGMNSVLRKGPGYGPFRGCSSHGLA